jgi:hypothetical protein
VGLGCGWLQPALPPYPSHLRPLGLRGRKVGSPASNGILSSAYTISRNKYSATLLHELTSWDVVSVTLSFLATRLRATLRGFHGGVGKLASKLVGRSWMRGTLGSPGQLNLDRSWNHSGTLSSSSSSDVSSTTTVLSPSPTSRLSLALPFEDHVWFEDRRMVASLCDE